MNLVELIKKMPHHRRRMLSEAVGKHLLKEEVYTAEALKGKAVGDKVTVGNAEFVKTGAGWVPDVKIKADDILLLVRDDVTAVVKKDLERLRSDNDYTLLASSLRPEIYAPKGSLTFWKRGDDFTDRAALSGDELSAMSGENSVIPDAPAAAAAEDGNYLIDNVLIVLDSDAKNVKITVPRTGNYDGFKSLFDNEVYQKIQKFINKSGKDKSVIKVPFGLVKDRGLFKTLSNNIFAGGIFENLDAIVFKLVNDSSYVATFDLSKANTGKATIELDKLVSAGTATKKAQ